MSTGELVAWLKTKGLHDYPDDCTKLESKSFGMQTYTSSSSGCSDTEQRLFQTVLK